jgi:hypothetical protein
VWRHVDLTQFHDEVCGVVAFVGSKRGQILQLRDAIHIFKGDLLSEVAPLSRRGARAASVIPP